jgi:protein-L-isoaspartate(D-aspartate) O-methyltransferase
MTGSEEDRSGNGLDQERVYEELRESMVHRQLEARDIYDRGVLEAMRRVPRHLFVPPECRASAYADGPLPIGGGQTISQPYIVALTLQLARISPGSRVLDIGTGSGYQAAVLIRMGARVYSIEIRDDLAKDARERLARLGFESVTVRCADGYDGWPEEAPFDAIVGAAAALEVPRSLVDQLATRGRLVLPVGREFQDLTVVEKDESGAERIWSAGEVRFVPMIGKKRYES